MSVSDDSPRTKTCVLTATGRSAIAVVAVSGPSAVDLVDRRFQAANGRALADQPVARMLYGHWGSAAGEDVVICLRSRQEVEVHCHGGGQSVARVLKYLVSAGCLQVDWHQWIAERTDRTLQAEAQVALFAAMTQRTAAILLMQFHGALHRELEAIRARLDVGDCQAAAQSVEELLGWSQFGLHLTQPWRVVIVGPPNVGKSSLINALVGYERAIVFDQPGTTRDVVSATTALDGWPVVLSDTAGLQPTMDDVEASGIALTQEKLRQADLTVWLRDATELQSQLEASRQESISGQADGMALPLDLQRTLVVVNKIDLIGSPPTLKGELLGISATAGTGITALIEAVAKRLVPVVPAADAAVPFTGRQVKLLNELLQACRTSQIVAAKDRVQSLLTGEPEHPH